MATDTRYDVDLAYSILKKIMIYYESFRILGYQDRSYLYVKRNLIF
jgi:hypothetical protein